MFLNVLAYINAKGHLADFVISLQQPFEEC